MKPSKPTSDGPITRALLEAVALRRQLIDAGMPVDEADHRVGQGLKALLANPRPEGWKFYCDLCRDTGWITVTPSPDELARVAAAYGDLEHAQSYSRPCGQYCKWTIREREKRRQKAGEEFGDDDLATAGQTKKAKGFTKFGR